MLGNKDTNKIRNCKLAFECPLLWENLKETPDKSVRFCDKCKENVVHVKNNDELEKCTSKCVMFEVDIEDISPAPIIPQQEKEEEITRPKSPKVMVRKMGKRKR